MTVIFKSDFFEESPEEFMAVNRLSLGRLHKFHVNDLGLLALI